MSSLKDNFTTVENGQIEFNIDNGLDQNLINYCNEICNERCNIVFDNENLPGCDCEVTRLYYAMVKLAEWEDSGLTIEQYKKLVNEVQRCHQFLSKEGCYFHKSNPNGKEFGDKLTLDERMVGHIKSLCKQRDKFLERSTDRSIELKEIKEEMAKLIAKNLIAWEQESMLPEVYLTNKVMYKKLTGEEYNLVDARKKFNIF